MIQFGAGNPGALKWTLLPIKLIELIAGLDEMNAFGPYVTRKSLWDYFGKAFSVDLSGAEKALSQMKTRKIELAIFSKELRESVLRREGVLNPTLQYAQNQLFTRTLFAKSTR